MHGKAAEVEEARGDGRKVGGKRRHRSWEHVNTRITLSSVMMYERMCFHTHKKSIFNFSPNT
jgi:hypothetical protein